MRTLIIGCTALAAMLLGSAAAGAGFVEPTTVLQTWHGTGGGFGWAVSELGDVDGDGAMDAISGEPFANGNAGLTYVLSGKTGAQLYLLPGAPGDLQGYAIADAGDTDGDGTADIVSGAPGSGAQPGRAYLYSGATGELLHTFTGLGAGDSFGSAVASAGDLDRDGHADVLVGATNADALGPDSGQAYVFSGRTYALIRTLQAGGDGDLFGSATDSTGDLDRDKVPDLVVGAQDAGADRRGAAYVFSGKHGKLLFRIDAPATGEEFGSFFAAGVGDLNGDRIPDVYVGDYSDNALGADSGRAAVYSGKDGRQLHEWLGSAAGEGMGPGREAGDVDGDGRPDLAIGSYTSSDGAAQAGQIEIYSGATGALIRRITSTVPFEQLGFDAVGLGDVNGDGIPDLLGSAANGDTVYLIAGTP